MKVIEYRSVAPKVFDDGAAKGVAARVVIGKADGAGNFCMRVFEIAPGGNTPRHTHAWEHEMFFHAGEGEVFCEGAVQRVGAGCVAFIPASADHQVRNVGRETLVAVCLVPASAPEL